MDHSKYLNGAMLLRTIGGVDMNEVYYIMTRKVGPRRRIMTEKNNEGKEKKRRCDEERSIKENDDSLKNEVAACLYIPQESRCLQWDAKINIYYSYCHRGGMVNEISRKESASTIRPSWCETIIHQAERRQCTASIMCRTLKSSL